MASDGKTAELHAVSSGCRCVRIIEYEIYELAA